MKPEDFIRMPLAELTAPKEGRICMTGRWWLVTKDDHVLFYKSYASPQCNFNKEIAERIGSLPPYEGTRAVLVPAAFVPHKCSDYH
jgi:hypothetical protein